MKVSTQFQVSQILVIYLYSITKSVPDPLFWHECYEVHILGPQLIDLQFGVGIGWQYTQGNQMALNCYFQLIHILQALSRGHKASVEYSCHIQKADVFHRPI